MDRILKPLGDVVKAMFAKLGITFELPGLPTPAIPMVPSFSFPGIHISCSHRTVAYGTFRGFYHATYGLHERCFNLPGFSLGQLRLDLNVGNMGLGICKWIPGTGTVIFYTYLGRGHCFSGYIGGNWDYDLPSSYTGNAEIPEVCSAKCNADPRCKYVSMAGTQTCSRYSSTAGTCANRASTGHYTWARSG